MKLKALRFITGSLLMVILPLLVIYFLAATNTGLQSLAWLARQLTPGLTTLQIQGRLTGALYIEKMDYHNKAIHIQLKQLTLDWRPGALLRGNLVINDVQAEALTLTLLNKQSEKKKETDHLKWLNHLYIQRINLPNIVIAPGNLKLQIKGSLTDNWDIQWQARLNKTAPVSSVKSEKNNLATVLQSLTGNLTANGVIQGEKLQPKIIAIMVAEDLKFAQWQAARLQVNIATDLTPSMNSILLIKADQLKNQNYLFNTVLLQAEGQINPALAIKWQLNAQLHPDESYQGAVTAQGTVNGNYQAPLITAAINAKAGKFNTIKFTDLSLQLSADLTKQAQIARLQLKLTGLNVKGYQFTPVQWQATLNYAQKTLLLQLAQSSVRYKLNDQTRVLTWQESAIQIYQQAQDVMAKGRLILNAQQYLNLSLLLPHYEFLKPLAPQQVVQGTVSLYVQQIAPFLGAVNFIQNPQGLLRADLQLTGTYSKPQIIGSINLANARVDVPDLNLQVRNIQLTAQGSPGGMLQWTGQAQSGKGTLYIKGRTALLPENFSTNINLTGNNITVSNTEHYKINVSPDLQAKYNKKRLMVTGVIKLPGADINLGTTASEAIELSKDVVFVGENHKKDNYTLPFYSQVQLIAGDAIHLQYEGLKTQLQGQVLINDSPDRAVTGTGQIVFHEGSYTYYGQTLKIREGSKVLFNGAIDNPALNIQAVKMVEAMPSTLTNAGATGIPGAGANILPTSTDLSSNAVLPGQNLPITVGVNVQGNVKAPEISLFSVPAILNQTDILSYLVVGQPSNQLNSAGAGLLFNAASNLNFGGTSQLKDVMQEVQKTIGVEFNIKSSSYLNPQTNQAQQNTSVVLSKTLSPRIYISYSMGLLEALNTLQIRYLLSKYWTLQSTTSSVGNGVDLLYMIERGK